VGEVNDELPFDPDHPPPWEPPLAGDEVAQLIGALDRMRWTFRWKAGGLDAANLSKTVGASDLTLGRLLKHLAFVEDYTLTAKVHGQPPSEPWRSGPWETDPEWVWTSADTDSAADLYALYDASVATARERTSAAIRAGGLDQDADVGWPDGRHASLRRVLFDLLEEYGRHVGHADLLREAVDGVVGEDPPTDWRP
jgi:hypothetical protein